MSNLKVIQGALDDVFSVYNNPSESVEESFGQDSINILTIKKNPHNNKRRNITSIQPSLLVEYKNNSLNFFNCSGVKILLKTEIKIKN